MLRYFVYKLQLHFVHSTLSFDAGAREGEGNTHEYFFFLLTYFPKSPMPTTILSCAPTQIWREREKNYFTTLEIKSNEKKSNIVVFF